MFDESNVHKPSKSKKKDQVNKPNKIKQEIKEEKSSEISSSNKRDHLNLVLIGHVDHGKSTIAGQILLQTGQIDERTITKYKKLAKDKGRDSWWLAYFTDTDEYEKAKGKTVECGKAYFQTKNKRYTIIDAPGHLNYVPNMIKGASMSDVALLIISARNGEFEAGFVRGGQTREHGLIALTLGISRVIVVVNKMDTIKWDEKRYKFIKEKINKFLSKDIGFKKKYIQFVPISGQKGINIKDKINDNNICKWYDGESLLNILDSIKPIKRAYDKALRIPIIDRYKTDGGLYAVGMIQQGQIKKGDTIKIMPSQHLTKINGVQIDNDDKENKESQIEIIKAGENVIISFDKMDKFIMNRLHSGSVICDKQNYTKNVNEFIAEIYVHEIPNGLILTKGYQSMFHCHNLCVLSEIVGIKKTQKIQNPVLREYDRAIIKIKLNEKCSLETYDECRVLGRFILRDQNKTVIIGKIKKIISSQSDAKNNKNSNDEQKNDEK